MVEEIDAGKVPNQKNHRVNYDDSKSLIENVERLKTEILPLYPEVVIEAIDKITDLEEFMLQNNDENVCYSRSRF